MSALELLLSVHACAMIGLGLASVLAATHQLRLDRRWVGAHGGVRSGISLSLLTPCKGADPELAENLRSRVALLEPGVELLIGVADPDDPAVALAQAVAASEPDAPIRVVITGPPGSANPKVINLRGLVREARGTTLGILDSNVRVPARCLEALRERLDDPSVDAAYALCLPVFAEPAPLPTRLQGAVFSAQVLPAIAGGYHLFGVPNLLGKVVLLRRAALEAVGGFEAYRDYLVEDGRLGRDLRRLGRRVVLGPVMAEVHLGPMRFAELWAHERRWMLLHRVTLPLVPIGMLLWNAWVLAGLALVAGGAGMVWPAVLLGLAAVLSILAKVPLLRARDRLPSGPWLVAALEALTAVLALAVWFQREVRWRGRTYRLTRHSRIVDTAAPPIRAPEGVLR